MITTRSRVWNRRGLVPLFALLAILIGGAWASGNYSHDPDDVVRRPPTASWAEPLPPISSWTLMRWGEVTILAPPAGSAIEVSRRPLGDGYISVAPRHFSGGVSIDAKTGEILYEHVSVYEREAIDQILATIEIKPIEPGNGPWPYSDTAPDGELMSVGNLEYVWPTPASGILLTHQLGGGSFTTFQNLRSTVTINNSTGEVVDGNSAIHPDDQQAFDRLLAAITIVDPIVRR